jgi:hypothetical protein
MYDFVKDQPQPLLLMIVIVNSSPSLVGIAAAIDHSKVHPRNDIAISVHHNVVVVVGGVVFLPLTTG